MIKNIITISLAIFIIVVVAILAGGFLMNNNQNSSAISMAEVAKHSSQDDCWVAVNSKVYDATSLLSTHTGGAGAIIPFCGKDGTQAFNTRGDKGPHPEKVQETLNGYLLGSLAQ